MRLEKKNFSIAKIVKPLMEDGGPLASLHITNEYTEICDGGIVVRMAHSKQQTFEFAPSLSSPVFLNPDDALNIASSLGKEDFIKAVIPASDGKAVQVEFSSGEIRILPVRDVKYPPTQDVFPEQRPAFSVSFSVDRLLNILAAFKFNASASVVIEFWGNDKAVSITERGLFAEDKHAVSSIVMPSKAHDLVPLPGAEKHKSGEITNKAKDSRLGVQ